MGGGELLEGLCRVAGDPSAQQSQPPLPVAREGQAVVGAAVELPAALGILGPEDGIADSPTARHLSARYR